MSFSDRNSGLNSLAFWYPRIDTIRDIPTPETHYIRTGLPLINIPYGEECPGFDKFIDTLKCMAEMVGYPCFLRTGETSGKHYWKDTCYVTKAEDIEKHVLKLLEFSAIVDMMGLATDVWVIRKFIPMESNFVAFDGEMPINKERRFFIKDGAIQCWHPYWPEFAFEDQVDKSLGDSWKERLQELNHTTDEDVEFLKTQTLKVAEKLNGYWSVDWSKGEDGVWYLIDMALGSCSFHYPDCPHSAIEASQ